MELVYQLIENYLEEAHTALVAFDVDMTLSMPWHPAGHHPNLQKHSLVLQNNLGALSEVEEDKILTLACQISGQQLAEANTPTIIQTLQQQEIATVAFTAS